MEDKNNNENNNKKNENEKIQNKDEVLSFFELFLSDIDILPLLNESITHQKKFISFIINQFNKCISQKPNKLGINLTSKILSFLINNFQKLGISFFSLLIKEEEFSKKIIFGFFYDNLFKKEIILLIQKIIDIFNFNFEEKEMQNPIEIYYKDLIDYGIIEQKDLKENEKRISLTEEEQIYVQIESILCGLKKYRNLGNDVEKDASEFFDNEISLCEQNLNLLKLNDDITNANIEFYQEKIEEIKNFKNKKPEENKNVDKDSDNDSDNDDNKKEIIYPNDNDVHFVLDNNNLSDEEEEEEEEMNTPEKIIEDIKELRKKPLKERIYFYKDEQIIEEENLYTEFKNYYFPLGQNQKDELKRQFCSFINSNGGRLYIGISDQKIIKGVVTNEKVTMYEKRMNELLKDFYPEIKAYEFLKFYSIPVKNNKNGKIIDNLFVFKIIIKKGDPSILYSISDKSLKSSIRLQGQCANLTAEEIHKEIIERHKFKNMPKNQIIEDEYEMNDPAPIITQRIINNEEKKRNLMNKLNNDKDIKKINNEKIFKDEDNEKNEGLKIEDYLDKNDNNRNKKTKKGKKIKKNKNKGIYRVEISNIDKNVDENVLRELFNGFNCQNLNFYKHQNGMSNGYMDFLKEEDANNCIETCNNMPFGKRNIKLSKFSFSI